MEARFATHKISEAALDRMETLVEALATRDDLDNTEHLRIARKFDAEIERAAANPTLRNMILSLSVIGQERRARSVEYMRACTRRWACAASKTTETFWRRCEVATPIWWSRSSAGTPSPE